MNKDSVDCRKVVFGGENGTGMERVGDFCFDEDFRHIYIWLPGTSGPAAQSIIRGPAPEDKRVWGWDGNEDKPTLTPSILAPNEWHGYMRAGRLESC